MNMTSETIESAPPREVAIFTPSELASSVKTEAERRKVLENYIKSHLKRDVDYGVIPGARNGKRCLLKPGAEKFCSLLQLRAEFSPDEMTLRMLGGEGGVVAYICRLIHIPSGIMASEGRGACGLAERQGNPNTTVKIAEKRAQIDAVLRLGFSDSFTQDIDEVVIMPGEGAAKTFEPKQTKTTVPKVAECSECKNGITAAVNNFSTKQFGKALCFSCQAKMTNAQPAEPAPAEPF